MRLHAPLLIALGLGTLLPAATALAQQPLVTTATSALNDLDLRTFVLDKPPADPPAAQRRAATSMAAITSGSQPSHRDTLRTTIGLGYVQGADWGVATTATGAIAGVHLDLDSLVTQGAEGLKFDHGSLRVSQPDTGWRIEAGDVFSTLAGPARGGRVSWLFASGREPMLSVYGTLPGVVARPTLMAYRDQLRVHDQTLLDAEVGSDRSHFIRSKLVVGHVELEASYRRAMHPVAAREAGTQVSVALWQGIGVGAGFSGAEEASARATSTTVTVRLPASRFVALTLERAIATSGGGVNAAAAASASITAGQMRLFHRYQWGVSRFSDQGLQFSTDHQQFQSLASFASGPRFSVSLQSAMEWRDVGRMPQWQELQTMVRLAPTTRLQVTAAVPHLADASRLRAQLTQALGSRYSLQVEYGRLSTFQALLFESDRPRFKIMLHRVVSVPTPRRGGRVSGRVIDELGRPVAGARVKLGPYSTDADAQGNYAFRDLARGDHDLSLDENHLPADYAWDGRGRRLSVLPSSRLELDLVVAPLNAIHGRVYVDRNANARYDEGEGVDGAVLRLQDRATMTDREGAYSFYNVWPGAHVIRLDVGRLPASFQPLDLTERAVTLVDGRPVTGADFLVAVKTRPIIWKDIR